MIIPCIDLQDGRAVQLVHGRKRRLAVDDVFGLLERFREYPLLHVIDLDAAMGNGSNARLVRQLCERGADARARGRRHSHGRAREAAFSTPEPRRSSWAARPFGVEW